MGDDDGPLVAGAFGDVRRFHVYDHDRDEWVMSGADFGDRAAVQHRYDDDGDLTAMDDPGVLVAGQEELSLVWEDGPDGAVEHEVVDMETAEIAARAIIDSLAERLDVERGRIRVTELSAPNEVGYFVTGPSAEEVYDG